MGGPEEMTLLGDNGQPQPTLFSILSTAQRKKSRRHAFDYRGDDMAAGKGGTMSRSNHVAQGTRIPPPKEAILCALVIDDDEPIAESIAAFLRTHGYESAHATSGQAGLALAWERRPQIVFCDLVMQGIDGYQVAGLLRSDRAYRPFLVALGDRPGEAPEQRAREAGFDSYLAKPVDAFHLLPLVQGACGEPTAPEAS